MSANPVDWLLGGVKSAYGVPQQKKAYGQAEDDTLASGRQTVDFYNTAGNRAVDVFNPVDNSASREAQNVAERRYKSGKSATRSVWDYYGGGAGKGPQNVRSAYDTRRTPMSGRMTYLSRQSAGGYAPSPTADRYDTRRNQGQGYLEGHTADIGAFGGGPTSIRERIQQRQSAGPTAFDKYSEERKAGFSNYDKGTRTAGFLDSLMAGGGDSGSEFQRVRSGQTKTGGILAGFDPTKTVATGQNYSDVRSQDLGPSYSEDFYTSQLAGKNPAYDMLQNDAEERASRAAAATGRFNSGASLKLQQRERDRLAAEEFAHRGALAAQADQAKQARLGALTDSAGQYEDAVAGNRRLQADLAGTVDKSASDLALGRDKLKGDTALGFDTEKNRAQGLLDSVMNDRRLGDETKQGALDSLYTSDENARRARMETMISGLGRADDTRAGRERDLDVLAGKAGEDTFEREKAMDALGYKDDDNTRANNDQDLAYGKGLDAEENSNRDFLRGMAKDVDTEESGQFKDYMDASKDLDTRQLDTASKRAAVREAYDLAAGKALSESQAAAIALKLKAAGLDAEFIHNFMQDVLTGGKLASGAGGAGGAGA